MHQRMRQFRQFVIKLLPQAAGQEGDAFEQPFDIGVTSTFCQERRQRRVALGKAFAELAQGGEFTLVVVVE